MGKYALSDPAVSMNSEGVSMACSDDRGSSSGWGPGVNFIEEKHAVLVIDDDELFLRAITNYLRRPVSAVFTAKSLNEAESVLRRHRINVVVSDFDLGHGELDGVQMIQALRHKYPSIKRAVICSASDVGKILRANGVDDILNKGTDLERLRLLVQQELD